MTEFNGKENKQRIIISIIMLVLIFVITIVVLVHVVTKTEKQAFHKLREDAVDADFRITLLIDDTYNAIKSMSGAIISHDQQEESEDVALSISSLKVGKLSVGVRLYYPDGSAYSENGFIEDVSQYVEYEDILGKIKDDRYISCCKADYLNPDEQVLEIFTPIRVEGRIIAIISAVLPTDSIPEYMVSESFEGNSETIIVDTRDATTILDTFHGEPGKFTEYYNRKDKRGKSINSFVDEVMACEETYTTLQSTSTGKVLYLYAVPSQIDNWVSIIFVEEDVAFADTISVGIMLMGLAGVEIVIFLIYLIWMLRLARRQVIGESKQLISQMMGDDGLFLINLSNDTRKTIYNHCTTAEDYHDEEKFSDTFSRYINNYVFETDREEVLKYASLDYLKELFKTSKEITVQYRDISLGIQRFTEMRLVKYSDTEILQSFKEEDKEIIDKLLLERLKEDYFALIGADLDSGIIRVLKKSPWYPMAEEGDIVPYTQAMKAFVNALEGETKEFFEKISEPKYLKEILEKEGKISFVYKSNIVKGIKWVSVMGLVVSRNKDNSPSLCTGLSSKVCKFHFTACFVA